MKVYSQPVAGLSTVVLDSQARRSSLGGDFRGTCHDLSLLTLPGFTLRHMGRQSLALLTRRTGVPKQTPETVGDGDTEENKSF